MRWWRQAAPGIVVTLGLLTLACGSTGSNPGIPVGGGAAEADGPAAGGAAAGGAADGAGGAAEPVPPIDGRWAMFSFEDPVGVELFEEAGVLSGLGCYGGLPTPAFPELRDYCRPLSGTADGRHLGFAFAAGGFTYAANIYASADGQRMAGDFHDTATWHASAFTWLRVGTDYPLLRESQEPTAVGLALEARSNRYGLEGLVDHNERPGYLAIYGHFRTIAGSLGAFWETEMAWNEAEQTLVAGPVAETAPDIATQLTLRFGGLKLVSVEAVFPSGETRTLQAGPEVRH